MMTQMVMVVIAMIMVVLMRIVFLILKTDQDKNGNEETESVAGDCDKCNQSSKTDMRVRVI